MPRTRIRKNAAAKSNNFAEFVLPYIENFQTEIIARLERNYNTFITNLREDLIKSTLKIPQHIANMTIGELKELPLHWSGNVTNDLFKSMTDASKSSYNNDDGYQTTSTNGSNVSNASKLFPPKNRKYTFKKSKQRRPMSVEKFKTPANRIPPNLYGTITPKVQPNVPQALLRHARLGEFVLSLNGSPVVPGSTISKNVANVNIPLEDGNVLSIQPHRGLRISQIPNLDQETRNQLHTLRDNLNKICSVKPKS